MTWLEQYRAKRATAADAVLGVHSGERVYIGSGCAVPQALVDALTARAAELAGVEILQILTVGPAPYAARDMADSFRCNTFFVGDNVREAVQEGRADYVPAHLHQVPEMLRDGSLPLDHALVTLSPPDEHGFCSFGIEVGVTKPAALAAKRIVAEINRHMPRTLGDSFIHVSKIDAFVEVDRPLANWRSRELAPVERRIGHHVANLVEDGVCLQVGIGGIPAAVLDHLGDRRDLGVHTEMFSDGLQGLIESGVVNGERKNFHPGKVVTSFIMGGRELYDFVHDNAQIEFHPSEYVNNPFHIARNDRMVAVNGALQVDLSGQVCADSLGQTIWSGFGGQIDFMRGATMSRGGLAITALPATARDGAVSRLVPVLAEGAGVVATRADVHVVVTEHGVAPLRGRNLRERARALIGVADPRFREELERAAHARGLLGRAVRGFGAGPGANAG